MTKLCPRGKAAAKRKFKVYPSAYANAYASKICAGKIKDPSGVKRKDFRGPKPMSKGGGADTGTVGEIRSKQGVIFNKVKRMVRDDKDLSPKRRKRILQQVKAKSEERMNRKNIEAGIQFSKEIQRGRRELFKSTAGKKIPALKVGKAVTAGAQSGMGRLEKSGIKKMMSGGFGIFSKKKKDEKKKSTQEENADKKKKRLQELRKEIGAKKGKMMIMIAIGKPKKANTGEFIEKPMPKMRRIKSNKPPRYSTEFLKKKKAYDILSDGGQKKVPVDSPFPIPRKRKKMSIYTKPDYEYQKKKKAYDILTNEDRRPPRGKTLKRSKGGDIIKKVASKLEKASKAHAGQAKTLRSIKVRGGGMAVQGMNFKGVY